MLVPILRAAHCRSTHHFFAIDALERIGTERGKRLAELLLKHYARYLKGAKDPDDSFMDFQNHVIHVSQNNWGGAARQCVQWFDKSMQLLNAGEWSEAAYACGVMSHYFTDPIMPLHTGQTERESVLHRPMEWSICKAYEEIYELCQFGRATQQLKLSDDSDWLTQAVLQGAAIAHEHYARLIEIYNLARGTVDPPRGLTKEARQILAELFDLAIGGWASILMRMAAQMGSVPPDCSLTLATVIAGIDMPRATLVRKFSDAAQQAEVKRIFDEFTETGKVVDNLPAEIKVVRKEFAKDNKSGTQDEGRSVSPRPTFEAVEPPLPIDPIKQVPQETNPAPETIPHISPEPAYGPIVGEIPATPQKIIPLPPPIAPEPATQRPTPTETTPSTTAGLSYDSPLVDAPSIGPKTAKRFAEIGIDTIDDFLSADASQMAQELNTSWIKPELIEDWQDQAQLVCDVPALCGYKAQLLVAVNCRTADDLADAPVDELYQAIEEFGRTKEAERILRSTPIPNAEEIAKWIESAAQSDKKME